MKDFATECLREHHTHLPHRRSYKLRKPAIDFSLSFSQKKRGFRLHLKTHKNHEREKKSICSYYSQKNSSMILLLSYNIFLHMGCEKNYMYTRALLPRVF